MHSHGMGSLRALIGIWATGILPPLDPSKVSAVLGQVVKSVIESPMLSGFLTAGVLAAIMSSLDSQFLCLGTMFTNDIVLPQKAKEAYSDKQIIFIARIFIVVIVALTYLVSLVAPQNVFDLRFGVSAVSGLVPTHLCGSLLEARHQSPELTHAFLQHLPAGFTISR